MPAENPFNLVQRPLGGFGGKVKSSRAKPATPDVDKRAVQRSP
jgi:hypothetical protein